VSATAQPTNTCPRVVALLGVVLLAAGSLTLAAPGELIATAGLEDLLPSLQLWARRLMGAGLVMLVAGVAGTTAGRAPDSREPAGPDAPAAAEPAARPVSALERRPLARAVTARGRGRGVSTAAAGDPGTSAATPAPAPRPDPAAGRIDFEIPSIPAFRVRARMRERRRRGVA
jgi:hypothetical protein